MCSTVQEYTGLDQVILTVGLVRAKQDVFVKEVKYLLVVTTPVEVILLALIFPTGDMSDDVQIYPSIFFSKY